MRRRFALALLLAASPAGAVWGPAGGGQVFQPDQAGATRLLGWEAGLVAFGPEGQGFWQFAYGQMKDAKKTSTLTTMAGRLNFRLIGHKGYMVYGGPGIERDTLKAGGTRKAWVGRVQAGVLICPARLMAPDVLPTPTAPPTGPDAAKSLDVGVEAGYRRGPTGFTGFDARVYLLLTL